MPKKRRVIKKASCDGEGIHAVYSNGERFDQKFEEGECESLKVSSDEKIIGWVMHSSVTYENDKGEAVVDPIKVHSLYFLIDGNVVKFDEHAPFLIWHFWKGSRMIAVRAARLHGNEEFWLYDLRAKRRTLSCIDSDCPDWLMQSFSEGEWSKFIESHRGD